MMPILTAGLLVAFWTVGCTESNPQPSPGAGDVERVPTGADAASLPDVAHKTDVDLQDLVAADTCVAENDAKTPDADIVDSTDQTAGPDVCQPNCQGKECGDDGCGGSCGTCPDIEVQANYSTMIQGCGADGQCHCVRCIYPYFDEPWSCEADCQMMFCMPNCMGKECGADGCGGSCGKCGWGAECGPKGQCVCAFP